MSRIVSEKQRPKALDEMEKLLHLWIQEKGHSRDSVNMPIICEKAIEIFQDLTKDDAVKFPFVASSGWFEKFKKRYEIHHVKRHGEAAGADHEAAERFVPEFQKYIEEENLVSQQIFNCDETGLFWKRMPSGTYLTKEEKTMPGHKPMKDRLTLLLCANASGDFMVKPLLVYHAENPRAFKRHNVCKDNLPVMWRANPKAWVNRTLFREWVRTVFAPMVKKYLEDKGLPLRCVLLMDNATAHPPDLAQELHAEFNWIKIKFIPANTSSLIQPMDQCIIANFKKLYTKHMFHMCFKVTNATKLPLREFWKNHFTIYNCVNLIDTSLKEMSRRCLNSGWKKLLKEAVSERDFEGFLQEEKNVVDEIVSLGRDLDLEVAEDEVEELVDSHREEFSTEDLKIIQEEREMAERGERVHLGDDDDDEELPIMKNEELRELLENWRKVEVAVERFFPDQGVGFTGVNHFNDLIMPYFHTLLKERKKQSTIDRFFKPVEKVVRVESDEPQPGPSGIKKMKVDKTPHSLPSVASSSEVVENVDSPPPLSSISSSSSSS